MPTRDGFVCICPAIAPTSEATAPWNDMDNWPRDERLPGKPDFWIKSGDEIKPISVIRVSGEADPIDLPGSAVGQDPLGYVFKVEEGCLRRYLVSYQSSDVGGRTRHGLRAATRRSDCGRNRPKLGRWQASLPTN